MVEFIISFSPSLAVTRATSAETCTLVIYEKTAMHYPHAPSQVVGKSDRTDARAQARSSVDSPSSWALRVSPVAFLPTTVELPGAAGYCRIHGLSSRPALDSPTGSTPHTRTWPGVRPLGISSGHPRSPCSALESLLHRHLRSAKGTVLPTFGAKFRPSPLTSP